MPLGYYLAFVRSWGLRGLWAGLGVAVLLGCVTMGVQASRDVRRLIAEAADDELGRDDDVQGREDVRDVEAPDVMEVEVDEVPHGGVDGVVDVAVDVV